MGVVLAGGQSTRMGGGDKTLLLLDGRPLLAHVLERLTGQVDALALSANGDPGRFAVFGLPVLADGLPGQGPLAGLLAGLDWAAGRGATLLLTAPADTPFLPADLVHGLLPAPAYAAGPERDHPLAALWPVAERSRLRDWLSHPGPRDVRRFAAACGLRRATFPHEAAFANLNTPAELDAARARIAAG